MSPDPARLAYWLLKDVNRAIRDYAMLADDDRVVQWLATEIDYTGPELSFPERAQRFVLFNDNAGLIQRLKKWLGDPQLQPTPLHNLLAQLPCTVFFHHRPTHASGAGLTENSHHPP